MSNWSRTADNALYLVTVASIVVATVGWFVILPTVGLLYSLGVLP